MIMDVKGGKGLGTNWLSAGRTNLEEGLTSEHLEPCIGSSPNSKHILTL